MLMLKNRFAIALACAVVALVVSVPAGAEAPKEKAASAAKAVLWPAADLKWADVPNFPVKMAVLWGDPAKGAHGALHKFPAGFEAPMHHHTADHHVVVVAGTMTLTPAGEAAKSLPAGSYFMFAGKKSHATKCEAGAECVLFIDCAGAWDVLLDDVKK
jgi:quercetin dioxygenase-like cupin family protein